MASKMVEVSLKVLGESLGLGGETAGLACDHHAGEVCQPGK